LEYEKVIKNYPGGSRIAYALLKQGLSFMNLGDKTSSKLLLQQVIKDYPNTNQARKYEQAILEYEKVIKNYPGGSRIAYALLKQGLSFMNLGDKTSSKLLLQQVIKDYPNTNQARIARAKLQEIK